MSKPAGLLLIDIQTGFDAIGLGARNNPGAEAAAPPAPARGCAASSSQERFAV